MKLLIYIPLLFISTVFVGFVLEIIDFKMYDMHQSELPSDGNSEKDSSETSEDDTEKERVELPALPKFEFQQFQLNNFTYLPVLGHFIEIPNPPPQFV